MVPFLESPGPSKNLFWVASCDAYNGDFKNFMDGSRSFTVSNNTLLSFIPKQ